MSTRFDDFYAEIEAEAKAQGPAAVRDLRVKEMKYAFLNALMTARRARHLTQAQLALQSGIAQTEISRIERGRQSPTLDTYSRLAAALDLQFLAPRPRRSQRRKVA